MAALDFVGGTLERDGLTATIDRPAGVVAGDLMLVMTYQRPTFGSVPAQIVPPAGWTRIIDRLETAPNDDRPRLEVFSRVAAPSEPATYLFEGADGAVLRGIVAYQGPAGVSGSAMAYASAASVTAPAVTVPAGDTRVLRLHVADRRGGGAGNVITTNLPSGYTSRAADSPALPSGRVSERDISTADALSLTSTGSLSAADTSFGGTVVLEVTNVAPNAPVLNSPVGDVIARTVTNRFSWTFDDDDFGDSQSEFQLQARVQGSTAWTVDVTQETPTNHYDVPAGTFTADNWEWRVRTRDSGGLQGPWSSPATFEATTPPPGPTITAPGNDETISLSQYVVTWSTSDQDAYQLRRLADNAGSPAADTVLFDTGQVNSSGARSRTVEFPTNNQIEHVQVRVLRNTLWSPYSTVRVNVSYTVPETPAAVIAVDTPEGAITISADNPPPGAGVPEVESFRVFRREVGDTGPGIRLAIDKPPSGSFTDWSVPSGVPVEYRVQVVGVNQTSIFSPWQS